MNNTTSIIVYRNPMEAAFWNSMNGDLPFIIMVSLVVGFVSALVASQIYRLVLKSLSKGRYYQDREGEVAVGAAIVAMAVVVINMI